MCVDRCHKKSPSHGAAPVARRAAAAVDLCDGCARKLWIQRSVIAHSCKKLRARAVPDAKVHGNSSNGGTLKITRARWPLEREDASVLTVTKSRVAARRCGAAVAPSWRRH